MHENLYACRGRFLAENSVFINVLYHSHTFLNTSGGRGVQKCIVSKSDGGYGSLLNGLTGSRWACIISRIICVGDVVETFDSILTVVQIKNDITKFEAIFF